MKRFIIALTAVTTVIFPAPIWAVEEIRQTCTPFYGGGVVCGAHTPVDTGFVSSVFFQAAAVLFVVGLSLFAIAKKLRRVYLLE